MKLLLLTLLFSINSIFTIENKTYVKNYYPNGIIKDEGWLINGEKNEYWFFYYENGNKKAEGHYLNNNKCNWWIYYNENKEIIKKSEYKSNKLNGITIIYTDGEISKAEKYVNGKHVKTWTSISEFKKDNDF